FNPKPAKATILYAKETPDAGGDTLFANMYHLRRAIRSDERDAQGHQDLECRGPQETEPERRDRFYERRPTQPKVSECTCHRLVRIHTNRPCNFRTSRK